MLHSGCSKATLKEAKPARGGRVLPRKQSHTLASVSIVMTQIALLDLGNLLALGVRTSRWSKGIGGRLSHSSNACATARKWRTGCLGPRQSQLLSSAEVISVESRGASSGRGRMERGCVNMAKITELEDQRTGMVPGMVGRGKGARRRLAGRRATSCCRVQARKGAVLGIDDAPPPLSNDQAAGATNASSRARSPLQERVLDEMKRSVEDTTFFKPASTAAVQPGRGRLVQLSRSTQCPTMLRCMRNGRSLDDRAAVARSG